MVVSSVGGAADESVNINLHCDGVEERTAGYELGAPGGVARPWATGLYGVGAEAASLTVMLPAGVA